MEKKRDYIEEIISKRNRLLPETNRLKQIEPRINNLWSGLDQLYDGDSDSNPYKIELLKYFPIGFVACIEGYFRLVLKDLIDSGPPFSDNVTQLKDIKFDISHVLAIHDKKAVTLGEFVSHLVPIRNIDDINKIMSLITGSDFLKNLLNVKMKFNDETEYSIHEKGLENLLFPWGKKLYELRHIYCHELSLREDVDIEIIRFCGHAAMLLIYFSDELVEKLIVQEAT